VASLEAVIACEVPPLDGTRPDLPADLVSAVHRALEKDPAKRFRSARQMARALARVLRRVAEPTDAEPLGQSVATARERLGMPPRDLPPEKLVPLRQPRAELLESEEVPRDSMEIPLIPRADGD
jgi:hypothetical protein